MTSFGRGGSPAGRFGRAFLLLRAEGGMSPINIPIKPPPRVNTADGINDSSGESESESESERTSERGGWVILLVEEVV